MNRYLQLVEARSADARAGFSRIVAEGGGQLVLSDPPIPGQPHPHNHHNQGLTIMPPPNNTRHRGHSYSRSAVHQPSQPWPTLPPPPHGPSRVRPRSGSMDGSYMAGATSIDRLGEILSPTKRRSTKLPELDDHYMVTWGTNR